MTVAELLKKLGGIPAERVLLDPPPGTATEKDVLAVEQREGRICELVDGVVGDAVAFQSVERAGDQRLDDGGIETRRDQGESPRRRRERTFVNRRHCSALK